MSYTDVFMTCAFIANSALTHTHSVSLGSSSSISKLIVTFDVWLLILLPLHTLLDTLRPTKVCNLHTAFNCELFFYSDSSFILRCDSSLAYILFIFSVVTYLYHHYHIRQIMKKYVSIFFDIFLLVPDSVQFSWIFGSHFLYNPRLIVRKWAFDSEQINEYERKVWFCRHFRPGCLITTFNHRILTDFVERTHFRWEFEKLLPFNRFSEQFLLNSLSLLPPFPLCIEGIEYKRVFHFIGA